MDGKQACVLMVSRARCGRKDLWLVHTAWPVPVFLGGHPMGQVTPMLSWPSSALGLVLSGSLSSSLLGPWIVRGGAWGQGGVEETGAVARRAPT